MSAPPGHLAQPVTGVSVSSPYLQTTEGEGPEGRGHLWLLWQCVPGTACWPALSQAQEQARGCCPGGWSSWLCCLVACGGAFGEHLLGPMGGPGRVGDVPALIPLGTLSALSWLCQLSELEDPLRSHWKALALTVDLLRATYWDRAPVYLLVHLLRYVGSTHSADEEAEAQGQTHSEPGWGTVARS